MPFSDLDPALRSARYERIEDGTFLGTVPGLRGVLAHAETLPRCRRKLAEVIEGWTLVRVAQGKRVPRMLRRPSTRPTAS